MVALKIFAEQHEVIVAARPGLPIVAVVDRAGARFFASVVPAAFRHIHFAADDRLYVPLARLIEKIRRGEKIPVVGDRHGRHFLTGSFIQKLRCLASPVEQTVVGVNVKVNELRASHEFRF